MGLFSNNVVLQHSSSSRLVSQYRPIADWAEWQKAFCIYEAIFTEYFPAKSEELKVYQMHIQDLALSFCWTTVNNYDRLFRHGLAEGLYQSWIEIDPILYNSHFNFSSAIPPREKQISQPEKQKTTQMVCKNYNADKCKWGSKCRWAHRCTTCNILGHPMTYCHGGKPNN